MATKIINLEAGMPTVEQARIRLVNELRTAKLTRTNVIKIIHGYGSSGKGGAIKTEVGRILLQKKREKQIRDYVRGEDFSPFTESARRVLAICPTLRKDADFSRGNDGITIVII